MLRNYSDVAFPTTLAADMNSTQTTMILNGGTSGLPPTPFAMTIDLGDPSAQELVMVTEVNGFTLSVQRNADGARATPPTHTQGSEVVHSVFASDFSEANAHINSTGNPHGLTKADIGLGNVDNTSDATKNSAAATLTNKTLTAPVINNPTGLTKANVGLGNVDNTSDATKNAATATLTNKTLDKPKITNGLLGAVNCPASITAIPSGTYGGIALGATAYTKNLDNVTDDPYQISFTPSVPDILITAGAFLDPHGDTASRLWISFQITRNSDGAVVVPADDSTGICNPTGASQSVNGTWLIHGVLTAGVAYTVTMMFHINSAAATSAGRYSGLSLAVRHAI